MPVFVSYSHADAAFAGRLAEQLVKHKAQVWIDQWELSVGDSLIDKIQKAIEGSSALLVVLSKASVESEWCKKELSSGLIRELEEKRVVLLPILLEDCKIPLFLKDKVYADFRNNFDDGLRKVLEAIAKVTSENLLRVDAPDFNVDWAADYGTEHDHFFMHLIAVEQAVGEPYTVLTQIHVHANGPATERYSLMDKAGLGWAERAAIIDLLCEVTIQSESRMVLEDEKERMTSMGLKDTRSDCAYSLTFSSRRLGADTGKDILIDIAGQLRSLRASQIVARRKLSDDERRTMDDLAAKFKTEHAAFDHILF
ncbi:MAG: toll/interleukin-1 receptor domain-containing protein [Bryobacteraceae bacterium]